MCSLHTVALFIHIYNLFLLQEWQLKCQEKDNEILMLHDEIFKLGNQVKYLNKKCNALQDNWRQKKVRDC